MYNKKDNNMNQELLVKNIEHSIESNQTEINKSMDKLAKNFVYNFSWVGEDLFMRHFKNDMYKALLADINEYGAKAALETEIAKLKMYTRSAYQVRENSTGTLHREASTWRFICMLELLNELESYSAYLI
jgi:hypothetical protein